MNFNWEVFGREKIAVHCKTEAEAIDFCKRAEEKGFNWAIRLSDLAESVITKTMATKS